MKTYKTRMERMEKRKRECGSKQGEKVITVPFLTNFKRK